MAAPVSKVELDWRLWRLREGRYKGYTGPRPAHFPKVIPAAWWARLAAFLARRAKPPASIYTGPYAKPGLLWRRSDSEDVGRAFRAGFRWGLLQLGADNWDLIRRRLGEQGMPWGYWYHCRTLGDLHGLLNVSRFESAPLVGINVEKELETTLSPAVIRRELDASGYQGAACTILLGWQGYVENGQHKGPDMRPIGHLPALLEVFPQDAPAMWPPTDSLPRLLDHARALGSQYPMQLMGAYRDIDLGTPTPGWYDRTLVPSHVYTADDLGDRFEGWA